MILRGLSIKVILAIWILIFKCYFISKSLGKLSIYQEKWYLLVRVKKKISFLQLCSFFFLKCSSKRKQFLLKNWLNLLDGQRNKFKFNKTHSNLAVCSSRPLKRPWAILILNGEAFDNFSVDKSCIIYNVATWVSYLKYWL